MKSRDVKKNAELVDLVRGIVRQQGNIFVRELLRSKGIPIGSKKDDFEAHLLEAIDQGTLSREDLLAWLEEVEGWGDQHVYLFGIPESVATDALWSAPQQIRDKLPPRLRGLWNADASSAFPDQRTLTGIYFDNATLRFVWHQQLSSWVRTPEQDQKDVWIEGDRYEMRAYRERPDRSVQRFVVRLDLRMAAAFLEMPWSKTDHEGALGEMREATRTLVDWDALQGLAASDAIKNLDQKQIGNPAYSAKVGSQRTRLSDGGTYVEFATSSPETRYTDSQVVRNVRSAVEPEGFTGTSGSFLYTTNPGAPKPRTVRIEIFEDRRIRLWHQLRMAEVWDILTTVKEAEKWSSPRVRTGQA